MEPLFLEGKLDIRLLGYDSYYDHGAAVFGYVAPNRTHSGKQITLLQWYTCRDYLQQVNPDLLRGGMCFTHKKETPRDPAYFLQRIEEILLFSDFSSYRETVEPHILWINPHPFWLSDFMKRSFYSMMLRCAYNYERAKDNFEEALWSITYSNNTKAAVKKFLAGYTEYKLVKEAEKDICSGWYKNFQKTKEDPANRSIVFLEEGNVENIKQLVAGSNLIARRAYDLWQQNGGSEVENWLQAETELLKTE